MHVWMSLATNCRRHRHQCNASETTEYSNYLRFSSHIFSLMTTNKYFILACAIRHSMAYIPIVLSASHVEQNMHLDETNETKTSHSEIRSSNLPQQCTTDVSCAATHKVLMRLKKFSFRANYFGQHCHKGRVNYSAQSAGKHGKIMCAKWWDKLQ
jgi:hypothetical protein